MARTKGAGDVKPRFSPRRGETTLHVCLSLPQAQGEWLDALARQKFLSRSGIIREMIRERMSADNQDGK